MFLCFAAVSIRNEETRTAINENLVQPFLNFKSNHEVTHVSHIYMIGVQKDVNKLNIKADKVGKN